MTQDELAQQRYPGCSSVSVESLCEAFQRDCVAGLCPQIESYVARVEDSQQPDLVDRLLMIEVDHRRGVGEHPAMEEYAFRFPAHREILEAVVLQTASRLLDSTAIFQSPANCGESTIETKPAPAEVGRYKLIETLGSGSFGQVWRALDPLLGRQVAIKILRQDRPQYPQIVQRLKGEARKMADLDLNCPGIVRVLDVGSSDSGFFIVSQLIEGGSLADRMSSSHLSHRETIDLVAAAADALHQVHLKGLTHRDLKPANILLDLAGRPHIADFGLAISEDEQLLEGHSRAGTVAYMAPEQARGESNRVDSRTDVWALGIILYQLLCHRLPFKASNLNALLDQIVHREPRPLRTVDDSIPPELERICLKCLSKSMQQRYTTARDLATDLRRSVNMPDVSAQRRYATVWLGAVVCVLALICAVWTIVQTYGRNSDSRISQSQANDPGPQKAATPDPVETTTIPADPGSRTRSDAVFKPLISSPGAKGLTLQTIADRTALRAGSESAELVSLGRLDTTDNELEIAFQQNPWTGDIGLFFGYGPGLDGVDEVQEFQSLILKPDLDGSWKLIRIRYSYLAADPGNWKSKNLASVDINFPASSSVTLRIRFDGETLTDVVINGESKPALCDAALIVRTVITRCSGRFGLHLNHSSGVLSNLTINGTRLKFATPELSHNAVANE